MKILITGGSGYLATSTAYFLSKKNEIILLTRNPNKIKNMLKKKIKIIKLKNFKDELSNKVLDNCNCIIHFAGMNKSSSNKFVKKAVDLKSKSTISLIKFAIKNKIRKFIYISSMQIYKNYSELNSVTEKNSLDSKSGYNKSHIKAEQILQRYKNKIDFTILRPSSIFGFYYLSTSKELIYTILNNFCYQAKFKGKINIENPNTVRNFLPLSIFVKFLRDIINNKFNSKNKIINIGYKSFTLENISKIISERFQKLKKKKIIIKKKIPALKNISIFNYITSVKKYKFKKNIFIQEIDHLIINLKK